jgi:hypothetical protein
LLKASGSLPKRLMGKPSSENVEATVATPNKRARRSTVRALQEREGEVELEK